MKRKVSKWKKIRQYLLAELIVLAVIGIGAKYFYSDTAKSVRLEITSRLEGAPSQAEYELDRGADWLARYMGTVEKTLSGKLYSDPDKDYDDCIGVALLIDYFDAKNYEEPGDRTAAAADPGKGDGLFLNGSVALLTVYDYPSDTTLDETEREERARKTSWDLTEFFSEFDLRSIEDYGRWPVTVDEVYGHETADGHFTPTKVTFISRGELTLQSSEYRADDVLRAKRGTGSEAVAFFFSQPERMCALTEMLSEGDTVTGNTDRYWCKMWAYGDRYYFSEDHDWSESRLESIVKRGNAEISYESGDSANVIYYLVIDFGTIVWRKAGRKILAMALLVQVGVIVALVIRYGINRKREQLKRLRDTFINAMAHELKTPAAVVRNTAEYLATGAKPEKQEHYLNVLLRESDSINTKLNRMLTYTRVMDDTITLEYKATDWNKMADEVLASYEDLISSRGMKVVFEERTYEIPVGDPALMGMVIDNLIGNAVRYGEPGSTIIVRTEERRFSVWNKTEPLSEEELAEIWTPMFQTDRRKADSETGGMGLAISAGILDRHGADYGVCNEGDGLLFWFDFSKVGDTRKYEKWSWGNAATAMINLFCAGMFGFMYVSSGEAWHLVLECLWLVSAIVNVIAFAVSHIGKKRKKKNKPKTA